MPADQIHILAKKTKPAFQARCDHLHLETDLTPWLETVYLPLAAWVNKHKSAEPMVLGINGAQGSGKSTLAALLQTVLSTGFNLRVTGFSIDDIYLTRSERDHLAKTVHPLLSTRGVPGTHDVALGLQTLQALKKAGSGDTVAIPSFDKALDDRKPRPAWLRWEGPVDIILFDGWCVGARPQPEEALVEPVNQLERIEDPKARWRRFVNDQLKGPYQHLFAQLDHLMMLKVPDMECIFRWRLEQEHKLARFTQPETLQALRLMNDTQLHRFIQHYERLTRWMLEEMPDRADVILNLNDAHQINTIQVNTP